MSRRAEYERMSGFDASYFYSQSRGVNHHGITTAIVEADPRVTFENVVAGLASRLDLLPMLRRRAVHVPLALHHPVWVTLPTIDLAHHVRRTPVGGAGTFADLEDLQGRIVAGQLDPDKPLWELHYCEGLADDRIALVVKMHHSVTDGRGMTTLFDTLLDEPRFGMAPVHVDAPATTTLPSRTRLVSDALLDRLRQLPSVPALLLRTLTGLRAAGRYDREHRPNVPKPILSSPRLSFHGRQSETRRITMVKLDFADFVTVRAGFPGTTLNDVLLATVSGAVRQWLAAHGESPSKSLTSNVLVSLDTMDDPRRDGGNLLSQVFATLATDVDDPAERLRAIARTMHHAKELNRRRGPSMMIDWFELVPGGPISFGLRARAAIGLANLTPAPFSLTVSNMRGPREIATAGGVPVADMMQIGPLVPGIGFSATAFSYRDHVNLSLMACPDLFADLDEIAGYLAPALAEYVSAVAPSPSEPTALGA